ncbi:MAG: protein-tyrosine phosphatase [Solirubrobacteraceae bacterium]|jgi:protein-tyrosine phosphatase|nr:protein-tyrosine phosphatase [Solirubrobacteraceae bacterium]
MITDAGGVELADGRRMLTGMLYRISGALAGGGELAELERTGVKTVVDLRAEFEDRATVVDWAEARGVGYFNYPIVVGGFKNGRFDDIMVAIREGRAAEELRSVYGDLALNFGPQLAAGFERLSEGFPAGFGCAAGKDRTGVMTAYLHVLLGATEETAVAAYLDKAPSVEQLRPQMQQLYDIAPDGEISEGMMLFMAVQPSSIEHAFDRVRERGGVEQFLRDSGLSGAAIERLRDALISD